MRPKRINCLVLRCPRVSGASRAVIQAVPVTSREIAERTNRENADMKHCVKRMRPTRPRRIKWVRSQTLLLIPHIPLALRAPALLATSLKQDDVLPHSRSCRLCPPPSCGRHAPRGPPVVLYRRYPVLRADYHGTIPLLTCAVQSMLTEDDRPTLPRPPRSSVSWALSSRT